MFCFSNQSIYENLSFVVVVVVVVVVAVYLFILFSFVFSTSLVYDYDASASVLLKHLVTLKPAKVVLFLQSAYISILTAIYLLGVIQN